MDRENAKCLSCPHTLIWFCDFLIWVNSFPFPPTIVLPSGQVYHPSLKEMEFFRRTWLALIGKEKTQKQTLKEKEQFYQIC